MFYYNDLKANLNNLEKFLLKAVQQWQASDAYQTAINAELYDKNENPTIKNVQKYIYDTTGGKHLDLISANNKIATNIFNTLLTWTTQYSMANGLNYTEGVEIDEEVGGQTDSQTAEAVRLAIRDGVVFNYYDGNNSVPFTLSEFCPFYDEKTNELMAGIRFKQINDNLLITLYEIDGYTEFVLREGEKELSVIQDKIAYKLKPQGTPADGVEGYIGENFTQLPIIKLKGNRYGISMLKYVRDKIDSYDLILSGFANDIDENAFIYWIIKNAGGMNEYDIGAFKQSLRNAKVATIDTDDGSSVEHMTKDIPTESRSVYLEKIKNEIYEAWMAVDMSKLASGAVNEMQVNAMYANADNKAGEIENEIRKYIIQILAFKNIQIADYDIFFIRNKLQSEQEQAQVDYTNTQSIVLASTELSQFEILTALKNKVSIFKNIDVDQIIKDKEVEMLNNIQNTDNLTQNENEVESIQ